MMASSITPRPINAPYQPVPVAWYVPVEATGFYLHTDGEVRQGVRHNGKITGYFDTLANADAAVAAMLAKREAMR
jgi:hypothetical protein